MRNIAFGVNELEGYEKVGQRSMAVGGGEQADQETGWAGSRFRRKPGEPQPGDAPPQAPRLVVCDSHSRFEGADLISAFTCNQLIGHWKAGFKGSKG